LCDEVKESNFVGKQTSSKGHTNNKPGISFRIPGFDTVGFGFYSMRF